MAGNCFLHHLPGKHVDDVLPSLLQYKVDAILITSATVSSRMAAVCVAEGIPVVLFNRYVPGLKVAAVSCDNVAGGRAVADYLWSTGHVRPAFVSGESDVTTNLDRAQGFRRRLRELGMALHALDSCNCALQRLDDPFDRLLQLPL